MSNAPGLEGVERPAAPMGTIQVGAQFADEKHPATEPHAHHDNFDSSEKKHGVDARSTVSYDEHDKEEDDFVVYDPFKPFDDLPDESTNIVTIRAMVVGCICGAAVNASNVYLGLKTGWTFTANLFGAIVGFSVLKSLAKFLPENFPILGGNFGPRENNIVQTSATAAGGLSGVFISGIPALYQLELLSTPQADFPRLITLTIVGGYFGFAFATPLRKFFIIYLARELNLIFPTPSATSMTIRSMHLAATGEHVAKLKMRALGIAFSGALVLRVVSQYAIGILWDWHIFTWFFIWGGYKNVGCIEAENWGWFIEFTPAFIGAGMLVGLNTAISFYAGSVIAWGIIGPTLVKYNIAFGKQLYPDDPKWEHVVSYYNLGIKYANKTHPSPRFWLLWPGVLLMIVVSFVELALQYKIFIHIGKAIHRGVYASMVDIQRKRGKEPNAAHVQKASQLNDDLVKDSAEDKDLVPWYWWGPLLLLTIIFACVVMGLQFDMPVGMSLLSIFLAFFFALLAIQCTGVTDITPLTAASKASQLVLGGATKGEHWATDHAQRLNLLGGSLASMGANQSSDLVSDFRVGFLLRTPPKQQWIAQGLGTLVAVFLAPAMFILFTKAYPCIIDVNADKCPFSGPSIQAWRATAVAVTDPVFPVPRTSGIFAIVFSIFGAIMIIIRQYAYNGRFARFRKYHPNMMCIGLAFVLNSTVYGWAMVMGSVPAWYWAKKAPKSFEIYGFAIAAGLIAGEGIGGVINAIFQIAGIAGPDPYGTNVACPGDAC